MKGIFPLKGVIKHYDWGGFSLIPEMLLQENQAHKPYAEYWMGTHPLGMGQVKTSGNNWSRAEDVCGTLPYLLKVLDVRDMLSIQVHPGREEAEAAFARENEAGIPLDAPNRNYKDPNHKPEMMVALSEFWLLHGFKPEKELSGTLEKTPELNRFLPVFLHSGYKALYQQVMEMPSTEVHEILAPLLERIQPDYAAGRLDKSDPSYWAAKAALHFNKTGVTDRGIFSVYFFNLVHLQPGQGIFQGAGVPHAYLEGANVELMANSDNVLRGGLTSKHIDVQELLRHVSCAATRPAVISPLPDEKGEYQYPVPVPDFRISLFRLNDGARIAFKAEGPEILLCTKGKMYLTDGVSRILLEPGFPAALVTEGVQLSAEAGNGGDEKQPRGVESLLFRASGGIHKR